jgi:hypothetical protein
MFAFADIAAIMKRTAGNQVGSGLLPTFSSFTLDDK